MNMSAAVAMLSMQLPELASTCRKRHAERVCKLSFSAKPAGGVCNATAGVLPTRCYKAHPTACKDLKACDLGPILSP